MSGADIVAIVGIAGTLLGTALGSLVTWIVQHQHIKHDDETRFHERRLDIYATYNGAVNRLMACLQTGNPHTQADFDRQAKALS